MQLCIKNCYLRKASYNKQMTNNYKKLKQIETHHETNIYGFQ